MMLDRYELKAGTNFTTFEFVSEGRKGKVTKVIQFQSMDYTGLYNLAFGDLMADGKIDDIVITDKGDSEKILATVVAAIYAFTHKYPDAWVYATGSTDGRTRLYRMGINKYFETVQADFQIFGDYKNEWEWYERGKDYQAFAVRRKKD